MNAKKKKWRGSKVGVEDVSSAWQCLAEEIKGSILADDEVASSMEKVGRWVNIVLHPEIVKIMSIIYSEPNAYTSQYVKYNGEIIFSKNGIKVNTTRCSMPLFCAMHLFSESLKFIKSERVDEGKLRAVKVVREIMQYANSGLGKIDDYLDISSFYSKGLYNVTIRNRMVRGKKVEIGGKNSDEISINLREYLKKMKRMSIVCEKH